MKCKNCDSNVEILFVVMANGKEVPIVASSLTDEEFHYMVARKKSEPKLKHKLHHVIHQCKKNTVKENKPVRKKSKPYVNKVNKNFSRIYGDLNESKN